MALHICPVCGTAHEVHRVLDALSYGRPRTCSPRCKTLFPALARVRVLAEMRKMAHDARCRLPEG
ncbi:MAG: hypothetical protein J0I91_10390 [Candidatus Accumulibacter sp.]|nr:hypothetical protein [Accumulibacter sp.]